VDDRLPVSAIDRAPDDVVRRLLRIDGRILDALADDGPATDMLGATAEAALDLLGASRVEVELAGRAGRDPDDDRDRVVAGDRAGSGPGSAIEVSIGHGDRADAVLRVAWPDGPDHPTELDREVIARLDRLILLILDRGNAKHDQLLAVTREREAFAGEIHDDPIQMMTAVSLELQVVAGGLPESQRRDIEGARHLTEEAIDRLRHIMYSLHPPTLDEEGLLAAIEAYCETYVEPLGLGWTVDGELGQTPVPLEVAALAFRLARGAIVNTVKHARATLITITIGLDGDRLQVRIVDDGRGFDITALARTPVGHFGIPHASTLASWVGGSYQTDSRPGAGTTVVIDLPLA
jgi:signal transduction histidine kinase